MPPDVTGWLIGLAALCLVLWMYAGKIGEWANSYKDW
jgi:hypothetical protein